MNYRRLGKTGVLVSDLCLGTMTFGNEADENASREIMDRAFDAGINFFDAAHNYNKGVTEEIVGRWLGSRRREIILTSKVFFPAGGGRNDEGLSRRNLIFSVEKSLKRLQTDYLDLLYLHHWDENVEVDQSLAALDTLVQQGKVIYGGVSNFAAWQTMKAICAAKANGYPPVSVVQPMYSLVKRQVEVEIFPMAAHEGLAVVPYNALGAGLLTGKYLEGGTGRLHQVEMYRQRYESEQYVEITRRFVDYARAHGYSPAALALAWVRSHPLVASTIFGVRNLAQLSDALSVPEIEISPAVRQEIGALSYQPPLATDREPMDAMRTRGW